jgi:hypothetical protein
MTYGAPMPYGAPAPYGAPVMYPPAYPMPYAVPFVPIPMVPGRETQAALDRLKQAVYIGMAASTMTFGIGLLAVGMHATGDARPSFATSPGFALHLIAFLLQVVAIGVAWVGLDDLKDGAREISQKHVEHFKRITNYLLFAGLTWAMGGIMAIVLGGAALLFSLPGGAASSITTTVLVYQGIMGAVGLVMNICIALCLQLSLAELMQRPGRLMTQMFYIFAIGGTAASFALSMMGVIIGDPSLAPVASVMSLLSLLIFLKQLDSAKAGTQSIISTASRDPDGAAAPAAALA